MARRFFLLNAIAHFQKFLNDDNIINKNMP
ncbi:hypothetical protein SAMN05428949_6263 [Chitinophaga sp. YR627]|nr:hypothetical protein SAMN05428949_6263 [Chitinophaga sp. YR627]